MSFNQNRFFLSKLSTYAAIALAIAASGCANSQNCHGDAQADNVICASNAIQNETYEAQTAGINQRLLAQQSNAESVRLRSTQLRTDLVSLKRRRQALETNLATLTLRLRTLESRLSKNDRRYQELAGRLAAIREAVGNQELTAHQISLQEAGAMKIDQDLLVIEKEPPA